MEHKKHTNSTKINICTWTPICIVVFCKRGSVLKFLRDRMSMCSSLKVFEFLEFMHSKWARRQLPGTVTKWSKFHQITMNMENWSTQNYQTNVFFNLRPLDQKFEQKMNGFCCARFAGCTLYGLDPKKWTCLVKISPNSFAGAMQHAKLKKKTCKFWIEDLCISHVLGICDWFFEMWYELQMHKKEMLRTRLQVNTQYMCIYI